MPRDGSGTYGKPSGTTAVSGTAVASAPYNTFCDDLVTDANAARPITAGGTGATNAATALSNLGGQPVDATTTAIAALSFSTGQMFYATGADTFALFTTSAIGRAFLNYTDPNADRILFFDDSAGAFADLTLGTGLSISGTTLNLSANLQTYSGITPSDNVQSFLGAADYAAMRTQISLGTAALATIGTSGDTVPKNNTANTWGAAQVFPGGTSIVDTFSSNLGLTINALDSFGIKIRLRGASTTEGYLGSDPTYAFIVFDSSGNQRMDLTDGASPVLRVNAAAIPTTSSTDTLSNKTLSSPTLSGTVAGAHSYSGQVTFTAGATTIFNRASSPEYLIQLNDNGSIRGYLGANSSYVLSVKDSGGSDKLLVATGGDIIASSSGPTSVYSLGYRGTPQNIQDGSYTFVLADAGKQVHAFSATCNYTIPPNSSVAFPIGTVIPILSTGATISVLEGSGVFLNRGDGTSGSGTRTVGPNSMAAITKSDTNTWIISGAFT